MIRWKIPKIWDGGEVWIMGGGSSVPEVFGISEDVVKQARESNDISIYSDYLSPIHDKHVLGVNMAYQLGDWLSGIYFSDRSFFKKNKERLPLFKKMKITHSNLHADDVDYHRDIMRVSNAGKTLGLSRDPSKIRWNYSSGAAAINVASLAGAKRILLLGFDMSPDASGHTHYHSSYGDFRIKQPSFSRFMNGFPKIADDAKKMGIEILNVNHRSALKMFKTVELKEVL